MKKRNNQNDFIPIERINPIARNQFKYKLGLKGFVGLGLLGVGVATLWLPSGSVFLIGLGLVLVSPISFKTHLKNKYDDIKFKLGVMF